MAKGITYVCDICRYGDSNNERCYSVGIHKCYKSGAYTHYEPKEPIKKALPKEDIQKFIKINSTVKRKECQYGVCHNQ